MSEWRLGGWINYTYKHRNRNRTKKQYDRWKGIYKEDENGEDATSVSQYNSFDNPK